MSLFVQLLNRNQTFPQAWNNSDILQSPKTNWCLQHYVTHGHNIKSYVVTSVTFPKSPITRFCNASESMTQESTLLSAQQTKRSSSAKSSAMLTYLSLGHWFLKCPTSFSSNMLHLSNPESLTNSFFCSCSHYLWYFSPLMTYSDSLDNSLELLLWTSSPRMRSRIFSKVNQSDPAELVTAVTVSDQLSGKDNSNSKAWTSSSNLMPTVVSLAKIEYWCA